MFRLTSSWTMSQLNLLIFEQECTRSKEELRAPGQVYQLILPCTGPRIGTSIFDGSTRLGEAIAIVARSLSDSWQIQQGLIRLDL